LHATADLWGPVFLGLQGEVKKLYDDVNNDNRIGAGVGIRF
jgi:hypothetical protein